LTQGIAVRTNAPVTIHESVALEALTLQDEDQARSFVARELGALARRDRKSEVLRATLRVYFSSGQNASSAAALLGVHERTIANRLRAVEARLGHPSTARRAEVETALRLEALLSEP
jgi:DNA-binding PucR family transcriptional regulator